MRANFTLKIAYKYLNPTSLVIRKTKNKPPTHHIDITMIILAHTHTHTASELYVLLAVLVVLQIRR